MKKFTYLSVWLVVACLWQLPGRAQVLNGDFELKRADGTIAYWAVTALVGISLDSSDCHLDSLYYLSGDAHSGNYALAMRSIACDSGVSTAQLAASDDMPAYGPSEPFTGNPGSFYFYYKFFPGAGSGVRVSVSLSDTESNSIAVADTMLTAAATSYTYFELPLNYIRPGTVSNLQMRFALVAEPGSSAATAGALFLVDDIGSKSTAITTAHAAGRGISVYPVPAGTELQVKLAGVAAAHEARLLVSDALGRVVLQTPVLLSEGGSTRLATGALAPGVYTLQLWDGADRFVTRFIK